MSNNEAPTFISVGPYCGTANILQSLNLREKSYPFDYIFSSLEMVKHAINDKFRVFLDKQFYEKGSSSENMHHSFYSSFIETDLLQKHHDLHSLPEIANKSRKSEVFVHHNLIDNEDTYLSFVRRCNRLLTLIENNNKIVFVYINQYTNDFNEIIDFYNNFSDNKNIYIVGIFWNDQDKKILYENENCKIYQNYDINVIFDEIKCIF